MNHQPTRVFTRYLEQLHHMLTRIEQHENGNPAILKARLAETMLPFSNQVSTAANFSLRACCPLAGRSVVSFGQDDEPSFPGLQQQLTDTVNYLRTLSEEEFAQCETREFQDQAGFAALSLPKWEYLNRYAIPNFFFHLSMVYAIARNRGVPLSKGDFDGYHSYPEGFCFETL